jgi:hypothetical protein
MIGAHLFSHLCKQSGCLSRLVLGEQPVGLFQDLPLVRGKKIGFFSRITRGLKH